MKSISRFILVTLLLSCTQNKSIKTKELVVTDSTKNTSVRKLKKNISWEGTIEKNVPVFIHYQTDSNIISGEIIYRGTKEKRPIKLIGTINKNNELRWLEFEASGNITGILTGSIKANEISGEWFSPKTRKSLKLSLAAKDTTVNSENLEPLLQNIFGKYFYQYSEEGPQGIFTMKEIKKDIIAFELNAFTSAPARNIADISEDTVSLNSTYFEYALPGNAGCALGVKFYNGFVYVHYIKNDCEGWFGHNATAEGIFLKL